MAWNSASAVSHVESKVFFVVQLIHSLCSQLEIRDQLSSKKSFKFALSHHLILHAKRSERLLEASHLALHLLGIHVISHPCHYFFFPADFY